MSTSKQADTDFWLNQWRMGRIGFHQDEFEPLLVRFFPLLPKGSQILVPLCGKSRDMLFLLEQGYSVTGVELSPLACEQFFAENFKGDCSRSRRGAFEIFENGPIRIFCGDFFDLTEELLGPIAAVYDRAAAIALPTQVREVYARHLTRLISAYPPSPILLITLEYPLERMSGPPFSVSEVDVQHLFGQPEWKISRVHREQELTLPAQIPALNGALVFQNVFRIERALNRPFSQK